MTTAEITNLKKIIKDIKYKLNEIEKVIDKTTRKNFGVSNTAPQYSPRKRNNYRDSDTDFNKK
ncbi:MAG: hypothetical protein IPM38_07145 [Ignavibacteria bacterium]|nr:hypothetical protein [Ignavibacteria bacterium]